MLLALMDRHCSTAALLRVTTHCCETDQTRARNRSNEAGITGRHTQPCYRTEMYREHTHTHIHATAQALTDPESWLQTLRGGGMSRNYGIQQTLRISLPDALLSTLKYNFIDKSCLNFVIKQEMYNFHRFQTAGGLLPLMPPPPDPSVTVGTAEVENLVVLCFLTVRCVVSDTNKAL